MLTKVSEIHDKIHKTFGVPSIHLIASSDKIQPQATLRAYCRYACWKYLNWDIKRIAKHAKSSVCNVSKSISSIERILVRPKWNRPIESLIIEFDKRIREELKEE